MSNTLDPELFELCKEVYEKTGWTPTGYTAPDDTKSIMSMKPLYTSDYLLEKLPNNIENTEGIHKLWLTISPMDKGAWSAAYELFDTSEYVCWSDTPLKSLLKLVIALDDAGIKL
jgi:hypothetical protein